MNDNISCSYSLAWTHEYLFPFPRPKTPNFWTTWNKMSNPIFALPLPMDNICPNDFSPHRHLEPSIFTRVSFPDGVAQAQCNVLWRPGTIPSESLFCLPFPKWMLGPSFPKRNNSLTKMIPLQPYYPYCFRLEPNS